MRFGEYTDPDYLIGALRAKGFGVKGGVIRPPPDLLNSREPKEPTVWESDAIDFLCEQRDFVFENRVFRGN